MTVQISVALVLALFALLIPLVAGTAAISQVGMGPVLGNRDVPLPLTGWVARAGRAFSNLLENLIPFGIVAFALFASGATSALSETAALVFLAARLGHTVAYVAGIPGLRTVLYNAGVLATFVTAFPLLSRIVL